MRRTPLTVHYGRVVYCACVVLLAVAFSALVASLFCLGACLCHRGLTRRRSRLKPSWKEVEVPSDNFPLRSDGAKPLLVGDEDEDGVS